MLYVILYAIYKAIFSIVWVGNSRWILNTEMEIKYFEDVQD